MAWVLYRKARNASNVEKGDFLRSNEIFIDIFPIYIFGVKSGLKMSLSFVFF